MLRNQIVRLAHDNPDLREHLLPLLRQGAVDNNVALESQYMAVEVEFLKATVQGILRIAGRGTPVQGKPGSVWVDRQTVWGNLVVRETGHTLSVKGQVKSGKIILIGIGDQQGTKKTFRFTTSNTPAGISVSEAAGFARQMLMGN